MRDRGLSHFKTLSIGLLCLYGLMLRNPARGDDMASPTGSADSAHASGDFLSQWFAISDAAKESQPHWMTPLVTVTPRLEQEYRYDQSWQTRAGGLALDNYDSGKGLEFIPSSNTEVIVGVPAYEVKATPKGNTYGWADETVLGKYR